MAGTTISHNWNVAGDWYDYYYFTSITVTNSGTGYTGVPTITVNGGVPVIVSAVLTANMIPE